MGIGTASCSSKLLTLIGDSLERWHVQDRVGTLLHCTGGVSEMPRPLERRDEGSRRREPAARGRGHPLSAVQIMVPPARALYPGTAPNGG